MEDLTLWDHDMEGNLLELNLPLGTLLSLAWWWRLSITLCIMGHPTEWSHQSCIGIPTFLSPRALGVEQQQLDRKNECKPGISLFSGRPHRQSPDPTNPVKPVLIWQDYHCGERMRDCHWSQREPGSVVTLHFIATRLSLKGLTLFYRWNFPCLFARFSVMEEVENPESAQQLLS